MINAGTSGYVEWEIENGTNNLGGSLSLFSEVNDIFTVRYEWLQIGAFVVAVENGIAVFFQNVGLTAGDTMRIRVNATGKVVYEYNNTNMYNSQLRAEDFYPLTFKAFINTPGAKMLSTRISGDLTELVVDDE
jgi:hypothetical protein